MTTEGRTALIAPAAARNVELKGYDHDRAATLAAALACGARDAGTLHQRDTYFHVPSGRLKLREQRPGDGSAEPAVAQLIYYLRADQARQRQSTYRIVPAPDPDGLRTLLSAALGELGAVTKRRRLLHYRSVRIHLDQVAGLGDFIELEAVATADSDLAAEHALLDHLRAALRIEDDAICATGYAALLGIEP